MDDNEVRRKIGALKAIVQTVLLERYWKEDEEEGKREFLRAVDADDPVSMAIATELTEDELDLSFRWPEPPHGGAGRELLATPVVAYLSLRRSFFTYEGDPGAERAVHGNAGTRPGALGDRTAVHRGVAAQAPGRRRTVAGAQTGRRTERAGRDGTVPTGDRRNAHLTLVGNEDVRRALGRSRVALSPRLRRLDEPVTACREPL